MTDCACDEDFTCPVHEVFNARAEAPSEAEELALAVEKYPHTGEVAVALYVYRAKYPRQP